MHLTDVLKIKMRESNAYAEFCFKVIPGPGTNLTDPFFTTRFPGIWVECSGSPSDDPFQHVRMDTLQIPSSGGFVIEDEFTATYHEADAGYVAEIEEILPDSLFTAGTRIYYYIRASYEPGPGPYWYLPNGADEGDLSSLFEVAVLPDLCKDPVACLLYIDYYNRGAQPVIEDALELLGRTWDRFDLRAETSHYGNGIGNRLLATGAWRLRGPIGPSLSHMAQYTVVLLNNGDLPVGSNISDGLTFMWDDPTNDAKFLHDYLNEGPHRGLWLSGNNIAADYAAAFPLALKNVYLDWDFSAALLYPSYRDLVNHPLHGESCRMLKTRHGRVVNEYSVRDSLRLSGSGCPTAYDFDVIDAIPRPGARVSLLYDRTDLTNPTGYYASVDHAFTSFAAPFDTIRAKIDGFSLHYLADDLKADGSCDGNLSVAFWIRDVLGGNNNNGYFYLKPLEVQYCTPDRTEDPILDAPADPGRRYVNALFQNYPNPFRGSSGTTIHYSAARAGETEIRVFDVAGRLVRSMTDMAKPGDNFVVWDGKTGEGRRSASGIYFYQVKIEGFGGHKKMILLR